MGFFRTLARACVLWSEENALDVLEHRSSSSSSSTVPHRVGRLALCKSIAICFVQGFDDAYSMEGCAGRIL